MKAVEKWNVPADNNIVILDGGSEYDLTVLMDRLVGWCSPEFACDPLLTDEDYVPFAEPDLDNEHTGFAVKPGKAPKWFANLPLLFKKIGGDNND